MFKFSNLSFKNMDNALSLVLGIFIKLSESQIILPELPTLFK